MLSGGRGSIEAFVSVLGDAVHGFQMRGAAVQVTVGLGEMKETETHI